MKYRPEIDGLRAVAVLPVVLFHAGLPGFGGGFVGVDIFFVISGYLITSIILSDIAGKNFSLLNFYARRARRIVPALIFVIISCIPFAFYIMTDTELRAFFRSIYFVAFFVANVFFLRKVDYFEPAAELNPMLHTWSLAVEEQFYIFFPLLLLVLFRKFPRYVSWVLVFLAIISLVAYTIGNQIAPAATFYLLPTRIWELMAGAVCALHLNRVGSGNLRYLSILGLALIGLAIFTAGEGDILGGWGPQLAVVGAVLVILHASDGTVTHRLLGLRPVVAIGLVSYSAYLWHQPILAFARLSSPDLKISYMSALSLVLLTFILAALSWRFVEQPFRKRPQTPDLKAVLVGAAALILVAVVGLTGHITKGFQAFRTPAEVWSRLESSIVISPMRAICHERQPRRPSVPECIYPDGDLRYAVLGNSHGVELAWGISKALEGSGTALLHKTVSGCRVGLSRSDIPEECRTWMAHALHDIVSRPEIEVVILSFYMGIPARDRLSDLNEIVREIKVSGKDVLVVLQAPSLTRDIEWHATHSRLDAAGNLLGRKLNEWYALSPTISEAQAAFGEAVAVIDPAVWFCPEGQCLASLGNSALFYDRHHMTVFGAGLLAPAIIGVLNDYAMIRK